jgi:NitT/TauT family transport system substrate-binding protein
MGEVATNAVIEGYLAGTPITAVGSSHQYPYDVNYAVLKGSGIDDVTDLVGGKLGFTSPGSASEDIAYLMEEGAGLDVGDIELVPTNGLGGGIALLEGGGVDAALMIPIIYEANSDKFDIGFESLDYFDAYQKTVYIASADFLENNPEAVSCLLAGLDEAMAFIVDDPAAAAEIYADYNEDYTLDQLQEELELAVASGALDGTVGFNVDGLEAVAHARELRTGESVDIPWSDIFDPAFLPEGAATELPAN